MAAPITRSHDPVCGMDVDLAQSQHAVTHRGLTYHFCSQQCLERFNQIPALYIGAQRVADMAPILKKRCLKFQVSQPEAALALSERIRRMMGVKQAIAGGHRLTIEYDLRQVGLAQIEREAETAGARLKGGLHAWRRNLWKFEEHNELENLAHAGTGACCSRPPARLR